MQELRNSTGVTSFLRTKPSIYDTWQRKLKARVYKSVQIFLLVDEYVMTFGILSVLVKFMFNIYTLNTIEIFRKAYRHHPFIYIHHTG